MDFLKIDHELKNAGSENTQGLEFTKESYDCEIVIKNTDNKTAPTPGGNIYSTRKKVATALLDDNAPLVSVVLVGYNNLETYTKTCLECILKYTNDVDYELILVDNGSSDGTFEYYKSVRHPRKKIVRITKNIGAFYGGNSGMALAAGTYVVSVCNDVFVTKNWLSNMVACAMSDENIGMIGPMSNNVSNLQSVNFNFTDFADMQEKAAKFNVSSPREWHERLRLTSPMVFFKRECLDMTGMHDYGFFHDFADDDITFRVRRAGYKAILCKDVFVYHAGHSTSHTAEQSRDSLEKGRITFKNKYHGIDAWNDVNNYEIVMMSLIEPDEKRGAANAEVLGVDVLCGTPILEVKNKLRSVEIFDVRLSAFATEAKYWLDLKTICNGRVEVDRPEYLSQYFDGERFDYIVLGKPINGYREPYNILKDMLKLLKNDGHLLIKLRNNYDVWALFEIMGNRIVNDQMFFLQISLETLMSWLKKHRYDCKKIAAVSYVTDDNAKNFVRKVLDLWIDADHDSNFNRVMSCDYVIDIAAQ